MGCYCTTTGYELVGGLFMVRWFVIVGWWVILLRLGLGRWQGRLGSWVWIVIEGRGGGVLGWGLRATLEGHGRCRRVSGGEDRGAGIGH